VINSNGIDKLKKLRQLTNAWGIYQHGELDVPSPKFGYALDDQARALLVAKGFNDKNLEKIYLQFLLNAGKGDTFYHYFYDSGDGIAPDITNLASQDALGMMVWVLMETQNTKNEAKIMIEAVLKRAESWTHLRSKAYLILGLVNGERSSLEDKLTDEILKTYREDGDWHWFEDKLTYGNALIPWALWKRGRIRQDKKSLEIAKKTTDFLLKIYSKDGVPMPVAHNGLDKGEANRIYYDQQPIEAGYIVMCLEEAYMATNDNYFREMAEKWWGWFWGNNINKAKLIDDNFACYDGLTVKTDKVNLNQGAESNICFLMAYLAVRRLGLVE